VTVYPANHCGQQITVSHFGEHKRLHLESSKRNYYIISFTSNNKSNLHSFWALIKQRSLKGRKDVSGKTLSGMWWAWAWLQKCLYDLIGCWLIASVSNAFPGIPCQRYISTRVVLCTCKLLAGGQEGNKVIIDYLLSTGWGIESQKGTRSTGQSPTCCENHAHLHLLGRGPFWASVVDPVTSATTRPCRAECRTLMIVHKVMVGISNTDFMVKSNRLRFCLNPISTTP